MCISASVEHKELLSKLCLHVLFPVFIFTEEIRCMPAFVYLTGLMVEARKWKAMPWYRVSSAQFVSGWPLDDTKDVDCYLFVDIKPLKLLTIKILHNH